MFWIGFIAVVVYTVVATVGADLLGRAFDADVHPLASFALRYFVPVAILIAAGLVFAWRSGWWNDIWREPSILRGRPRRWWWIAVPVLMLATIVIQFTIDPWAEIPGGTVALVLGVTLCIGVGEELFFRGILVTSLRARHSEITVLIVSSLLFGLAHAAGEVISGLPLAAVALQVAFLSMNGALFYVARRVIGTLWAPILLHALSDGSLFLQSAKLDQVGPEGPDIAGVITDLLIVLSIAIAVSVARESRRTHRLALSEQPKSRTP